MATEDLKSIITALDYYHKLYCTLTGAQYIDLIFEPNRFTCSAYVTNSSECVNRISYLVDQVLIHEDEYKEKQSPLVGGTMIITQGVLGSRQVQGYRDKIKRFERFKSGDFSGISDDEQDEFLNILVKNEDSPKMIQYLNGQLLHIHTDLLAKYGLSDKSDSYKFCFTMPFFRVFMEYRSKWKSSHQFDSDEYERELLELISDLNNSVTSKLYALDFINKTIELITYTPKFE